jgi:uncharacterized RDD family membrane protein YckC
MLFRLRSLLGRRGGPPPLHAPKKLSLAEQGSLPPDLRLPLPGDPLSRIRAGLIDATLAAAAGVAVGAVTLVGFSVPPAAAVGACNSAALLFWVLRDALAPGFNRSPGKALCGLEVATREGLVAAPAAALARNAHFLLLLAAPLHPAGGAALEAALFFDVASCAFTPDARKVGDYLTGCRVVEERPGRDARLRDAADAAEAARLEARIRAAAPGLLEAEGLAERPWWDSAEHTALRFAREGAALGGGAAAATVAPRLLDAKPAPAGRGAGARGVRAPLFDEVRAPR